MCILNGKCLKYNGKGTNKCSTSFFLPAFQKDTSPSNDSILLFKTSDISNDQNKMGSSADFYRLKFNVGKKKPNNLQGI